MFKLFGNLKTRNKILLNNGILIAVIIVLIIIAYKGMRDANRAMDEIYNEHFYVVAEVGDVSNDLNAVRAALVVMMVETDKDKQKAQHEAIKRLTLSIDDKFKSILANNKFPQDMVNDVNSIKKVWEEFRDTRDSQLIPFIYEGKIQDAKALALGIQSERYKKITGLSNELLKKEKGEAEKLLVDYAATSKRFNQILLISSIVGILAGILFTILVNRFVVSPVIKLTDVAKKAANGELNTEFTAINTKCEIGNLSESMVLMFKNLRSILSNLADSINAIASASTELAANSEEMATNANSQLAQTNTITASMAEMENAIADVAKNSSSAAGAAVSTRETAGKGKKIVSGASNAVSILGENSSKISEIVHVIADIASKTDLLAINAAIEAANAGEHGKGFAVVADEVRKLAERTSRATGEIGKMIETIQKSTSDVISLMNDANSAIEAISGEAGRTSAMIEQIATASEEQASNVESIVQNIKQVSTSANAFTSGSDQISQATTGLEKLASSLQGVVKKFKLT